MLLASSVAAAAGLATETVAVGGGTRMYATDGIVEAVRSSVVGANLSGRVTARTVEPGAHVRAGEIMLRIDERVAAQQAAAAQAQLEAARAEFERKRSLHEANYLSKAAFERAEADFKSARAAAAASVVQTGLHTLAAPYAGRVAAVHVQVGDMVMPGQPLVAVYDPAALRVTAHIPQSQVPLLAAGEAEIEIPDAAQGMLRFKSRDIQVLPAADPQSQSVEVRVALPVKPGQVTPGAFARLALPANNAAAAQRVTVTARAVVRRSELTAVYVVKDGRARLRQVRLGRTFGDRYEVLAGLDAGDRVALDPLAAARQH